MNIAAAIYEGKELLRDIFVNRLLIHYFLLPILILGSMKP